MANTYTFTQVTGGSAKFKVGSGPSHIIEDSDWLDQLGGTIIRMQGHNGTCDMDTAVDTIIVGGTTYAAGSNVDIVFDALNPLFKKANSGNGGSGAAAWGGITGTLSAQSDLTLALAAKTSNLTPTAIKTAAYTAAANELVKTDATSATVPITLPTGQPDKTRIAVKMVAVSGAFTTTIAAGGPAVFNKAGGSTSATLSLLNQAVIFQFESATSIWNVLSSDIPLSQLDLRFATPATVATKAARHIVIKSFGDSLTRGTGSTYPYPSQLSFLTGHNVLNYGIPGDTSTQILTRFTADTDHTPFHIIWAGRNNYTSPTTVKADIAAMIAALGHTNYLVIGITSNNISAEWSGQTARITLDTLNSDLATTYGTKFVDMQAYLLSLYNAGTASAQDITDHNNGAIATSLSFDTLHRNTAGYAAVAFKISQVLSGMNLSTSVEAVPFGGYQMELNTDGRFVVSGVQALRIPDQSKLLGTIVVGDGGSKLVNTTSDNGQNNTLVGIAAGLALTTAKNNVAIGNTALGSNQTATDHIAIGTFAFSGMTGGSGNIGIGPSVGNTMTGGFNNFLVGVQCNASSATASNEMNICNALYARNLFGAVKLGIGVSNPLARLHLPAGTATANTAPLKLTSGVNLTVVENGAFEYDGTNLYFTTGGARKTVTLA